MVTIVDYGVGNLASIKNMLKKAGTDSLISSEESDILNAEKLILPGIGAFDTCAEKLNNSGLVGSLNKRILEDKTPILGICVGLQLLLNGSEEGKLPGLGWIRGKVVRFDKNKLNAAHKVPHMGWTETRLAKPSRLFKGMYEEPRFYFVHSYYAEPADGRNVLAYAHYGYDFPAALEFENILGVQFHPEKSHKFGLKLMENFISGY
jgi:glutamine amidotransferase